jgi:hypothetical protein
MEATLKNPLPAAELCRRNGWGVGTRLVGDEGYGPHTIEITAVGALEILAHCVSCGDSREIIWTLECRDWKPVR